jgi:hypothetical protein
MKKPLERAASFILVRRAGNPNLVGDDHHHKKQVKAKRPEDEEFGAFELPPRYEMLLGSRELIVFERR